MTSLTALFGLGQWSLFQVVSAVLGIYLVSRLVATYIRRRKYRLPPGPWGLPIIGRLSLQTHLTLLDHRDKYGGVSYMKIAGNDVIVLNTVDAIRDALMGEETGDVLSERPNPFVQKYVFGEDVIVRSMSEQNWKPQRKIFHTLLKQYGEGIIRLEKVVSTELKDIVARLDAKIGQEVNMDEYFEPSLINILTILLIGERFDYEHEKVKMASTMIRMMAFLGTPARDIILKTFPWLRFLPLGPGSIFIKLDKSREFVLNFAYREIKTLPLEVIESRQGIVYDMLKFQWQNSWVTDAIIEGIVLDIFAAGFITTDCSLRAFFLILVHHPHVQARIQEEIDDVIGPNRSPAVSDRPQMPYTMASILELSRYTGLVHTGVPHSAAKDVEFRGFTIPHQSTILVNLYGCHHDESLWPNSSEFLPERFLDKSGQLFDASHPMRKNLIPFGVGKRMCMGENFAKTRIFLYITYLLQAFNIKRSIHLPPCHPSVYEPDAVLIPPAYKVRMERRENREPNI